MAEKAAKESECSCEAYPDASLYSPRETQCSRERFINGATEPEV